MSEAGIIISEEEEDFGEFEEDDDEQAENHLEEVSVQMKSSENDLSVFTLEQLNKMLEDALSEEKYELAARIRDEIETR